MAEMGRRTDTDALATDRLEAEASSPNDLITRWPVGLNQYLFEPWWAGKHANPHSQPFNPEHFDNIDTYVVEPTYPCSRFWSPTTFHDARTTWVADRKQTVSTGTVRNRRYFLTAQISPIDPDIDFGY